MRKIIEPAGQVQWLEQRRAGTGQVPKNVTVPLMLSGDLHHYARYESVDSVGEPRQLITCGGGGAYMYGTSKLPKRMTVPPPNMRPPKSMVDRKFERKKRFPSWGRSVWLGLGAPVRLPLRNPTFVIMLALLQGLFLYSQQREPNGIGLGESIMGGIFFLLALFFAAGLSSGRRRWFWVLLLTAGHTAAQLEVGRLVKPVWDKYPNLDLSFWKPVPGWQQTAYDVTNKVLSAGHDVSRYVVYGLAAGIVSSIVVAVYLIVASLFGINYNELYASQRIEGFKAFLRMHLANDGSLTIYSVGLRRVRRIGPSYIRWHWKADPKGAESAPWFKPRRKLRPFLIETIRIPGPVRTPTDG
jgi:hypothetical protein